MRLASGARARQSVIAAFLAVMFAMSCVSSLVHPPSATAVPTTAEIEAKRSEAEAAQARLDEIATQLELRTEEYAAILEQLEVTASEISEVREALVAADRELVQAQRQLDERAAGIYRGGGVDILSVLLGTNSFQDFLTRLDWLRRVNASDADLVASVKDARAEVVRTQEALERRKQEQLALRDQAAVKKAEVQRALDDQTGFVESLNAEVARLVREEHERQERLAEERARKAAEEAARRAREAEARRQHNSAPGSNDPEQPYDGSALGAGHPEVVEVALRYVGVPYEWGGSDPSGFDCSGLTQYCYAQIGVAIPRTSRSQFTAGTHIPAGRRDLLVPGDLVFFGYDGDPGQVHHVGIYVGNGDYIHAPQTGQTVRVDSLDARISSRGDYVGASRL